MSSTKGNFWELRQWAFFYRHDVPCDQQCLTTEDNNYKQVNKRLKIWATASSSDLYRQDIYVTVYSTWMSQSNLQNSCTRHWELGSDWACLICCEWHQRHCRLSLLCTASKHSINTQLLMEQTLYKTAFPCQTINGTRTKTHSINNRLNCMPHACTQTGWLSLIILSWQRDRDRRPVLRGCWSTCMEQTSTTALLRFFSCCF